MFSGITTILFSSFWQYPPYFAVNSFKYIRQISAKFPSISTIFCRKFVHYNNQISILFVHYVDQIYPNLCIALTNFPQSTENTYICGIQFQISPNLCNFRNNYIPLLEFTYTIIGNYSIV